MKLRFAELVLVLGCACLTLTQNVGYVGYLPPSPNLDQGRYGDIGAFIGGFLPPATPRPIFQFRTTPPVRRPRPTQTPPPVRPTRPTPRPRPTPPPLLTSDPLDLLRESVPGEPGDDYPIYWQIPDTGFSCNGRPQGYYADVSTRCQVFRVCSVDAAGNSDFISFLCPNGTIFNQEHFTCDWWNQVDCAAAESHYDLNRAIGIIPESEPTPRPSKFEPAPPGFLSDVVEDRTPFPKQPQISSFDSQEIQYLSLPPQPIPFRTSRKPKPTKPRPFRRRKGNTFDIDF
ncbi:UNVERIFIED_CONTAM: hypothetical protein RMT77_008815 [Armadillidium vulgare]